MEKEDKLIRELLKEGFLKPAPDGFTDSVMQSVAIAEKQKELSLPALIGYILGSVLLGLGLIYLISPGTLVAYAEVFLGFLKDLFGPFAGLFEGVSIRSDYLKGSELFLGILLIIGVLLGFDRFLSSRKSVSGLFV
jgi:hypothetical protein